MNASRDMYSVDSIIMGRFTVVCGAFGMTSGKFAPIYKIYDGEDVWAMPVRRQNYPSPGPNYATPAAAIAAAEKMAAEWVRSTELVR